MFFQHAAHARPALLSGSAARFVAACPPEFRSRVVAVLTDRRRGGPGLRLWVGRIEQCGASVPDEIPAAVLEIYLADPDAEPLCDCEDCGLSVPVRTGRRVGHEPAWDHVYFAACPCCRGRTGEYAYAARAGR